MEWKKPKWKLVSIILIVSFIWFVALGLMRTSDCNTPVGNSCIQEPAFWFTMIIPFTIFLTSVIYSILAGIIQSSRKKKTS